MVSGLGPATLLEAHMHGDDVSPPNTFWSQQPFQRASLSLYSAFRLRDPLVMKIARWRRDVLVCYRRTYMFALFPSIFSTILKGSDKFCTPTVLQARSPREEWPLPFPSMFPSMRIYRFFSLSPFKFLEQGMRVPFLFCSASAVLPYRQSSNVVNELI